jgi:hypothetical protein
MGGGGDCRVPYKHDSNSISGRVIRNRSGFSLGRITSDDDDDLPAVREHEEQGRDGPEYRVLAREERSDEYGQDLPSGRAIGTPVRIRDMGTPSELEACWKASTIDAGQMTTRFIHRPRQRRRMDHTTGRHHIGGDGLLPDDLCCKAKAKILVFAGEERSIEMSAFPHL